MESKSTVYGESSTQTMKWPNVIIFKELHTLIGTVKEIGSVTTMDEVLEGMKKYILDKQLFDPTNPIRVCCKDDQLGSVLGVEEFTITQVKTLLMNVVTPVPNLRNCCKYGHIKLCKEEKECIFFPYAYYFCIIPL